MTAAEIGDPTGDSGTGVEIKAKETRRHSIMGTSRYLVADMMEVDMGTTAEAAVREGAMVQTPPPSTKMGRKLGVADRPFAKEVGRRRQNDGWGDGEKSVRSAIGAHRIVRPSISELTAGIKYW